MRVGEASGFGRISWAGASPVVASFLRMSARECTQVASVGLIINILGFIMSRLNLESFSCNNSETSLATPLPAHCTLLCMHNYAAEISIRRFRQLQVPIRAPFCGLWALYLFIFHPAPFEKLRLPCGEKGAFFGYFLFSSSHPFLYCGKNRQLHSHMLLDWTSVCLYCGSWWLPRFWWLLSVAEIMK